MSLYAKSAIFTAISRISVRQLHSAEKIGVDRFLAVKQAHCGRYASLKGNFIERISKNVNNEHSNEMIFTEDLKNMLFLMENTDQDVQLFRKMLTRYAEQGSEVRFSTFKFGSLIARAFYNFNNSDVLLDLIKDKKINSLFSNQFTIYLIAMDLAYKNKDYDQVIELYEHYLRNNQTENKYPRDLVVLLVASFFKQNTKESYENALKLIKTITSAGLPISRKTVTFFAYHAYRQGQYQECLESLMLCKFNYYVAKNLRILVLTKLGRFSEIFTEMNNTLNAETKGKNFILKEVIEELRNEIEKENNAAHAEEVEKLVKSLADKNLISDQSLESGLDEPEAYRIQEFRPRFQAENRFQNRRYNPANYNRGLRDFE